MFLRRKKTGDKYYLQLVESARTDRGPRSKVIASLGREDKLVESGELARLAESLSRYDPGHAPNVQAALGTSERLDRKLFNEKLTRQALKKFGFAEELEALCRKQVTPDSLAGLIAAALFGENSTIDWRDLIDLGEFDNSSPAFVDLLCDELKESQRLVVHIDKASPGNATLSPFHKTVTATAISPTGLPMIVARWLDHKPLAEMIQLHVRRLLQALPKCHLTLVVGRSLTNPGLLSLLDESDVTFVAPIREPLRGLREVPHRVFEERLPKNPFEHVEGVRFVRAIDYHAATEDREAREMYMESLRSEDNDDMRGMRLNQQLLRKAETVAQWDGSTLVGTNSKAEPQRIIEAYVAGRKASAMNARIGHIYSAMLSKGVGTQYGQELIEGATTLQIIATHLARKISAVTSTALGKPLGWNHCLKSLAFFTPMMANVDGVRAVVVPKPDEVAASLLDILGISLERLEDLSFFDETNGETHPVEMADMTSLKTAQKISQ